MKLAKISLDKDSMHTVGTLIKAKSAGGGLIREVGQVIIAGFYSTCSL